MLNVDKEKLFKPNSENFMKEVFFIEKVLVDKLIDIKIKGLWCIEIL